MKLVIVERVYDPPMTLAEVLEARRQTAWCMQTHRVRPLESMLSTDGRRGICVFEAPDLESVRMANRLAKLPVERIWSATLFKG